MSLFKANTTTQQPFQNQPSSILTNNFGGGFGNTNFNNNTFAFTEQTPQKSNH